MPRVNVVLKNGVSINVEGANDAAWLFESIAEGAPQKTLALLVYYKEPNKTEIRGRFQATEVVGYTIDPK